MVINEMKFDTKLKGEPIIRLHLSLLFLMLY